MITVLPAEELQWEEEWRRDKARKSLGLRLLLKQVTLACALIAATVAAATGVAAIFKDAVLR